MNKYSIVPLLFLLLLVSCNSEDSQLFDPTYFGESFKGITIVDESGKILKEDISDWCLDDNPLHYRFGPAYPNPIKAGGDFAFTVNLPPLPKPSNVRIYIINFNYEIIRMIDNSQKQAGKYWMRINTQNISPNIYRLVFETESFTCSGDIWIK